MSRSRSPQRFSQRYAPQVKSWVLIRPERELRWRKAVSAMIAEVRGDSVDLLVPNRFVLRHGWKGAPYKSITAPIRTIRPHGGTDRDLAEAQEALLSGVRLSRSVGLRDVLAMVPEHSEFLGCLGQYLWQDQRTGVITEELIPFLDAQLVDGGWIREAPKGVVGCGNCFMHTTPKTEKALIRLLLTSKTVMIRCISGMRNRRSVLRSDGSDAISHMVGGMCGEIQERFPRYWATSRKLGVTMTNPDEASKTNQALALRKEVELIKQQIQRSRIAKAKAIEAGLVRNLQYDVIGAFCTESVQRMWQSLNSLEKPVLGLDEVITAFRIDAQTAVAGLKVLQGYDRVFLSGKLVFVL